MRTRAGSCEILLGRCQPHSSFRDLGGDNRLSRLRTQEGDHARTPALCQRRLVQGRGRDRASNGRLRSVMIDQCRGVAVKSTLPTLSRPSGLGVRSGVPTRSSWQTTRSRVGSSQRAYMMIWPISCADAGSEEKRPWLQSQPGYLTCASYDFSLYPPRWSQGRVSYPSGRSIGKACICRRDPSNGGLVDLQYVHRELS